MTGKGISCSFYQFLSYCLSIKIPPSMCCFVTLDCLSKPHFGFASVPCWGLPTVRARGRHGNGRRKKEFSLCPVPALLCPVPALLSVSVCFTVFSALRHTSINQPVLDNFQPHRFSPARSFFQASVLIITTSSLCSPDLRA